MARSGSLTACDRAGGPPAVLSLHAGEAHQGIQLRLQPLCAVTGVVVDQDNDPVPAIDVQLVAPVMRRGKRTTEMRAAANTNSRGEFRISQVPAGRYYLLANGSHSAAHLVRPEVSVLEPTPPLRFAAACYPGVGEADQATLLDLHPGSEPHGLVFRVVAQQAASVTGKVELPEGVSPQGGLTVSFEGGQTNMGFGTQPDGHFADVPGGPRS